MKETGVYIAHNTPRAPVYHPPVLAMFIANMNENDDEPMDWEVAQFQTNV